MGDFFSSMAFLFKKSGKRATGSVHTNLTLFQKRGKTERKLGRYVKDVFERMDFPRKIRRGGGRTCKRPFIMVAQTTRLNIRRSDVPAVHLAARPYPHKCLVAPCLSSNPATDGSASSKMQNLRLISKSRRCLQANNKFADRVPL